MSASGNSLLGWVIRFDIEIPQADEKVSVALDGLKFRPALFGNGQPFLDGVGHSKRRGQLKTSTTNRIVKVAATECLTAFIEGACVFE